MKGKADLVKCREFEKKFAEMSCVHFTRLLDLLEHCMKKFQELRILRKSSKNRDFSRANWILRPAILLR